MEFYGFLVVLLVYFQVNSLFANVHFQHHHHMAPGGRGWSLPQHAYQVSRWDGGLCQWQLQHLGSMRETLGRDPTWPDSAARKDWWHGGCAARLGGPCHCSGKGEMQPDDGPHITSTTLPLLMVLWRAACKLSLLPWLNGWSWWKLGTLPQC